MRFNNERPIFLQISDHLTWEIIAGRLAPNERLPSARELATSLEVNANTAARALQALADAGVARCERGTGYFVANEGLTRARENLRDNFYKIELPGLLRTMTELGIGMDEIGTRYQAWLKTATKGNPP